MTASAPVRGGGAPARPAGPVRTSRPHRRRLLLLVSGILLAVALAGAGAAWAVSRDDGQGAGGGDPTEPVTDPTDGPPEVPADEQCTEGIQSNERWVCLTSATLQDGQLVVDYQANFAGSILDINGGYHLHIWGSDGTNPPDASMGDQAGENRGVWVIKDDPSPVVLDADDIAEAVGDQPKVCARIADGNHALVPDLNGGYATGNCVPITTG
jgi:molecular chaperone DnaK